jgi:hypothetical protein
VVLPPGPTDASSIARRHPLVWNGEVRSTVYVLRRVLRHRWPGSLVLVALVALTGAAVLAAWAGARRTESAFPRMLAATGAEDASVSAFSDIDAVDPDVVAGIDGVERTGVVDGYGGILLGDDGELDFDAGVLSLLAPDDATVGSDFAGFLVTDGRLPHSDAPDEVIVSPPAADTGIGVGSRLEVCVANLELIGEPDACDVQTLHVVGIGTAPADIVVNEQTSRGENGFLTVLSPAFTTSVDATFRIVVVDLADGTDLVAFTDAVIAGHEGDVSVQVTEQHTLVVERATTPYVRALDLFAIALAVTALGILGPALVRNLTLRDDERKALHALGFDASQRYALSAVRGLILGTAGAVAAVALGYLMSGRFPVGPVRIAEPNPGRHLDGLVASVVAGGIVALATAAGLLAGRWRTGRIVRRSRVADRLAGVGASPSAVIGVQSAFRNPSGTGSAVAAVASTAIAAAAVAAALVFGAGLTRMLDEPARFGFAWDGIYQAGDVGTDADVTAVLAASPLVRSIAEGTSSEATADGVTVGTVALRDGAAADPGPIVVDGRLPAGPDEVAMGAQTLDRLGKDVGDRVVLVGESSNEVPVTVVGTTLLPITSRGDDFSVGEGVLVQQATMDELGASVGFVLFDTVPGATVEEVATAVGAEAGLESSAQGQISGPNPTGDLVSYDQVRWVPLALASLLALLGLGVLAHTLITSGRAQRGELAVLRCLGFRRRDVLRTSAWRGGALTLACLLVGLPIGVAFGRRIWETFADSLGVVPTPSTPMFALVVVSAVTVAIAIAVACLSGLGASRGPAAELLRVE